MGIEWKNRIKKLSEHKRCSASSKSRAIPFGLRFITVILSRGLYLFLNINLYYLALEEQLATSLLPSYLS
jgi:hypothetical protein